MNNGGPLSILRMQNERLKMWIGAVTLIITNIVTLGTAVSAHFKEEKETTAKAAYKELSTAVQQMSEDNVQLHKDLANMRGYLAGLSNRHNDHHYATPLPPEDRSSFSSRRRMPAYSLEPAESDSDFEEEEVMEEPPKMQAEPQQYIAPDIESLK